MQTGKLPFRAGSFGNDRHEGREKIAPPVRTVLDRVYSKQKVGYTNNRILCNTHSYSSDNPGVWETAKL